MIPTLRHLTEVLIAAAVWHLPDGTIQTEKITRRQYANLKAVRADGARLIHASIFPALDTADGYAAPGDCWEVTMGDETALAVAFQWEPEFTSESLEAEPPDQRIRRSRTRERRYRLGPTRQYFTTYDLAQLPDVDIPTPRVVEFDERQGSIPNHRSATFDTQNSTTFNAVAGGSFALTVASQSDRYLAAMAMIRSAAVTSIGWDPDSGGVEALTSRLSAGPEGAGNTTSVYWDLFGSNQPSTGAGVVAITMGGLATVAVGAVSVYGVDQTTPRAFTATTVDTSATPTLTVSSDTDQLVLTHFGSGVIGFTIDGTWTSDWDLTISGRNGAAAHIAGASPSVTRTDTGTASGSYTGLGASLAAAGGGGATGWGRVLAHERNRVVYA